MPGNSHCLEHVRMCACGYLHVAQVCLQSFRLARQDEEHDAPRTPGVDWFWCAHTARCCSLNLWRSLSAVCVKAAIFTPQTGTGAIKKKKESCPLRAFVLFAWSARRAGLIMFGPALIGSEKVASQRKGSKLQMRYVGAGCLDFPFADAASFRMSLPGRGRSLWQLCLHDTITHTTNYVHTTQHKVSFYRKFLTMGM